jgi:hypothetical protein
MGPTPVPEAEGPAESVTFFASPALWFSDMSPIFLLILEPATKAVGPQSGEPTGVFNPASKFIQNDWNVKSRMSPQTHRLDAMN